MTSLSTQKQVGALIIGIYGRQPTLDEINQLDSQYDLGSLPPAYIATVLMSQPDADWMNGQSDFDILSTVYSSIYQQPADANYINSLLEMGHFNAAVASVVMDLFNYLGDDPALLAQQQALDRQIDDALFPHDLPGSLYQEQVAAVFLAVPERAIDASSLDHWSNMLASGEMNYHQLIGALLATPEFQQQIGDLQGDAFIQHIYQAVHGRVANAEQLAAYRELGDDQALIVQRVVEDLRGNDSPDAVTQHEQWQFARDIGNSLTYQSTASLSTSEGGGNAYGTVNGYGGHSLSDAETAVLYRVFLDADAAVSVDLSYAYQLSSLTVNGTSAAKITLHNNQYVSYGVDVILNNANVTLNGTYGGDTLQFSALAQLNDARGNFLLDNGNDRLLWAGNGDGGANQVGAELRADGGAGHDVLSANLIVKSIASIDLWGARVTTIDSNVDNFRHFEQLDMAGYIGQAEATLQRINWNGSKTDSLATQAHVFDYGLLTGDATAEGTRGGYVIQHALPDDLGSAGLLLSGKADNVKVINASGAAGKLEIDSVGNQADSLLQIDFLANALNRFEVLFSGGNNAGTLVLNSSGDDNPLSQIAITTGAWRGGELTLAGDNQQVREIILDGKAALTLHLSDGYDNLALIDASGFERNALNLTTGDGGSGDGMLIQMLDLLPLSDGTQAALAPILTDLGLHGEQLLVKGGGGNDRFNVAGDTTLVGGGGNNSFSLQSSTAESGVTLRDFSLSSGSISDALSNLRFSTQSGSALTDYGISNAQDIEARVGALSEQPHSASALLAALLDLDQPGALSAKAGISSVLGEENSSYLIVDNNDNHALDAADSVIMLQGLAHQALLDGLHYAPQQLAINGVADQPTDLAA
ncbi:TPA: DUF4214 domain-containing protein [Serratia odorifera]|nr:DUF4214 domain-containing protein [Serratia odorifera]